MKPLTSLVKTIESLGLHASDSSTLSMIGRIRGISSIGSALGDISDPGMILVRNYLTTVLASMRLLELTPYESGVLCQYIEGRGVRLPQHQKALLAYWEDWLGSSQK